jgi:hypothetical protein
MSRHFIILLLALLAGPAWAQTTAAADPAAAAASAPAAAAPAAAASAPATPPPPPAPLDARVQQLKSELVRLNRDLLVLEEELLFPAELESVQVKMGNQVVGQHLYTPAEVAALKRGGVQRLWLGNLKSGTHAIDAFFTGRGPKQGEHQRDYKRGTTLSFEKTSEPRYIELRIRDAQGKLQPEFDVKVW